MLWLPYAPVSSYIETQAIEHNISCANVKRQSNKVPVTKMSDTPVRHYILITCIATSFLATSPALADWSGKSSQNRYNSQFGDFPPDDIDQHLQNSLEKHDAPTEPAPTPNTSQASPDQYVGTPPQGYQQPNYNNRNQQGNYNPRSGNYRNNYNGPRGNNSGFSGPWNNNGSNFSMPWGNSNGSGSNMPWGNSNGSGSNMPWSNNNGSNFSMPWGNFNGNNGNR